MVVLGQVPAAVDEQLVHGSSTAFRSPAEIAAFAAEWCARICNITTRNTGQAGLGTGFFVHLGDNSPCMLTNHHVLRTAAAARDSDVVAGPSGRRVRVDLAPEVCFVTSADLDYTLVAVRHLPPGVHAADVLAVTDSARAKMPVQIFQAPGGGHVVSSSGVTDSVSKEAPTPHVLYTADTDAGSSGAPVLDMQGLRLVALHHQAVTVMKKGKQVAYNRGVLMTKINMDILEKLHHSPASRAAAPAHTTPAPAPSAASTPAQTERSFGPWISTQPPSAPVKAAPTYTAPALAQTARSFGYTTVAPWISNQSPSAPVSQPAAPARNSQPAPNPFQMPQFGAPAPASAFNFGAAVPAAPLSAANFGVPQPAQNNAPRVFTPEELKAWAEIGKVLGLNKGTKKPAAKPATKKRTTEAAKKCKTSSIGRTSNKVTEEELDCLVKPRLQEICDKPKFHDAPKWGNKDDIIQGLLRCGITFDDLIVDDLKEICGASDLPVSGAKHELIDRIKRDR